MSNFQQGMVKMQTQLGGFQTKMTKSFSATQNNFNKISGGITKAIGAISVALGGFAIGSLIKDSTSAAMSVESSVAQINRIMQNNASIFTSWAQNQSKEFGMAREDAYKYGATYGNLVSGFEKDTSKINSYTTQLLQASAVAANATGRTVDDVMERIRSGILGNTESIEDLGVYANISMIETTDAFKNLANGKTWDQLDYNTQQQIRVMSILEQVTSKYGDTLASTTITKQNQFIATLKNIRLNIGLAFLPIYNVVLPALNSLASKVEAVTSTLSELSQALFGKALTNTSKSTETQTQTISDLGDATEKAAKSAKKATMAFDELNIVNSNSTSGNASTTATTSGSGTTTEADNQNNGLTQSFEELKKVIEPTTTALKNLWDNGLSKLAGFVATGVYDLYNNFMVPVGKWALGKGIPGLVTALNNLLSAVDWDTLNSALGDLFDALSKMTIGIGQGLVDFAKDLSKALKPAIGTTSTLLAKAISSIADSLDDVDAKTWENVGYAIGVIATAIGAVKIVDKLPTFLLGVGNGLETLTTALSNFAYLNPVALPALFDLLGLDDWMDDLYKSLPQWCKDLWEGFWDVVTQMFIDIFNYDYLMTITQDFIDTWNKVFDPGDDAWYEIAGNIIKGLGEGLLFAADLILEPINDLFTSIVNGICDVFGINSPAEEMKPYGEYILLGLLQGLKDGWTNAWTDFSTWLGGLPKKIADGVGSLKDNFLSKGSSIISGIKKGWSDGWETFTAWLGGLASKIASSFGSLKDNFLSKGSSIISGIKQGWSDGWSAFTSWIGGLGSKIASSFGSLKDNFLSKGGQIISGIKSGWSDGWEAFKTWLSNIPNKIASGIGSLKQIGIDLINDFIKGFKSVGLPKIKIDVSYTTDGVLGEIGKALGLEGFPKLDLKFYKNGGLPETGELFIANEAGPEMIGRMGNQSAVANTDQIVEGITRGVSNANSEEVALLRQQNSLLQAILERTGITTKSIYSAVKSENDRIIKTTGRSQLVY